MLRDPWDIEKGLGIENGYGIGKNGSEASMDFEDFIDAWELGSNGLIFFK